jgi:hypothetical protein
MNELVEKRLLTRKKKPKAGYHPNSAPYKVIVHPHHSDPYIKREYVTKEKAERYALELSKKYRCKITIEYIKVSGPGKKFESSESGPENKKLEKRV